MGSQSKHLKAKNFLRISFYLIVLFYLSACFSSGLVYAPVSELSTNTPKDEYSSTLPTKVKHSTYDYSSSKQILAVNNEQKNAKQLSTDNEQKNVGELSIEKVEPESKPASAVQTLSHQTITKESTVEKAKPELKTVSPVQPLSHQTVVKESTFDSHKKVSVEKVVPVQSPQTQNKPEAITPAVPSSVTTKTTESTESTTTVQTITKGSWAWPTKGKTISHFTAAGSGNKGIDIQGILGQPIRATAAGKIVYSGSGVRGYGNLIIIKHNQNYLSAYAHNKRLLVKEGDRVNGGQVIAEMGKDETGKVLLHFEIRYNGKPVDPGGYLR